MINYRKLKSQIHKDGQDYVLKVTPEQDDNGLFNVRSKCSKTYFLKAIMPCLLELDEFRKEFTI